jgi:acyl-coenzyme A thioesterase PaaI-like protein
MWRLADEIDANLAASMREGFARQGLMQTIGARLETLEAGRASICLPFGAQITQRNKFVHAGIITAIVDTACGTSNCGIQSEVFGACARQRICSNRVCGEKQVRL